MTDKENIHSGIRLELNYWGRTPEPGNGCASQTLRCGYCCVLHLFVDNNPSIAELTKHGWIHTKKYGWVCYSCNPETKRDADLIHDGFGSNSYEDDEVTP